MDHKSNPKCANGMSFVRPSHETVNNMLRTGRVDLSFYVREIIYFQHGACKYL